MDEGIQSAIERIRKERARAAAAEALMRAKANEQLEQLRRSEQEEARREWDRRHELEEKARLIITRFLAIMNAAGNPGTMLFGTPTHYPSLTRMRGWIVARCDSPGAYLAMMTDGRLFWEDYRGSDPDWVAKRMGYYGTTESYQIGRGLDYQYGLVAKHALIREWLLEALPEGAARILADCGLNWDTG